MTNGEWFRSLDNKAMGAFIYKVGDFEDWCTGVVCRKCAKAHGGHCPCGDEDLDKCIYGGTNDIEVWLSMEREEEN